MVLAECQAVQQPDIADKSDMRKQDECVLVDSSITLLGMVLVYFSNERLASCGARCPMSLDLMVLTTSCPFLECAVSSHLGRRSLAGLLVACPMCGIAILAAVLHQLHTP